MSLMDWKLLALALGGVIFLVFLIVSRAKFHPLIALLLTAILVGLFAGLPAGHLAKTITDGAGHTLGSAGMVIALGAMLGKILADSGVTRTISDIIINNTPLKLLPWAMALVAFIVGIPMFFEVGLVMLLPLVFGVAKRLEETKAIKGSAYVYVGTPVIASLAAMHGMVPPHPGPLTAIASLDTSVGATMIYGFAAAVPAIILGGPLYSLIITPRMTVRPEKSLVEQFSQSKSDVDETHTPPSLGLSLLTALFPAILMLQHALLGFLLPESSMALHVSEFIGAPITAMLIGVLFAASVLVYIPRGDVKALRDSISQSVKPVANVLLIIAGGGAFQHVLSAAGVGDAIMHLSEYFSLSPIILGWLVAMLLSVSTGSATVGIVGAAGLMAPFAGMDAINIPLLALSIGCGSLFFNYANHAGFWFVKESFGMTMKEATLTITTIQSIVSVVGLLMVLLLNLLPPIV